MNKSAKVLLVTVTLALAGAEQSLAGDIFRGGEIYAENCQQCHGADGRGVMPGTPDLTRGWALMRPDTELFQLINDGKGVMPSFEAALRNQDMLNVIGYLRTLR